MLLYFDQLFRALLTIPITTRTGRYVAKCERRQHHHPSESQCPDTKNIHSANDWPGRKDNVSTGAAQQFDWLEFGKQHQQHDNCIESAQFDKNFDGQSDIVKPTNSGTGADQQLHAKYAAGCHNEFASAANDQSTAATAAANDSHTTTAATRSHYYSAGSSHKSTRC